MDELEEALQKCMSNITIHVGREFVLALDIAYHNIKFDEAVKKINQVKEGKIYY